MTSNIPYQFKHFDDVPVRFMPTNEVAKAVAMDAIIPEAQMIEDRYNMGNVVSEVIRRNQEAIDLMNQSMSEADLYPRANEFNGNDDDYLDELHNMMDKAGDVAHDKDWEDKPSFANNTPENRWRDLRGLADSVFNDHTMEPTVNNKREGNEVDHDLKKIQETLDSYDYVDVTVWTPPTEDNSEETTDSGSDSPTDPSNLGLSGVSDTTWMLLAAALLGGVVLWQR